MVISTCQVDCEECDRFSNFNLAWHHDVDEYEKSCAIWSERLNPKQLTIIGGEPLIHPDIYDIVRISRKYFKESLIEIYTNGFLLDKKNKIYDVLCKVGNSEIAISHHFKDQKVRKHLNKLISKHIFSKSNSWIRTDKTSLSSDDGVTLRIWDNTKKHWSKKRRVIDGIYKPFNDENPTQSYTQCNEKHVPILYNNILYKCPPISQLKPWLESINNLDDEDWAPYIKYKGLSSACSEDDLQKFIDNIYHPHFICNMCPSHKDHKFQKEARFKSEKLNKRFTVK